jgi:putative membrane protein
LQLAAELAVAFVALQHLLFMGLEMFLWNRPAGRRLFGLDQEFARRSAALAANQGLYNGFLAVGLAWGLLAGPDGLHIKVFFLTCIIVAGIFGALTVRRSILWIQTVPGAVALALVYMTRS